MNDNEKGASRRPPPDTGEPPAAAPDGAIRLPGGWSLFRSDTPGPNRLCWFLSNPDGVWVAKFWDGTEAGQDDARAFADSIGQAFTAAVQAALKAAGEKPERTPEAQTRGSER